MLPFFFKDFETDPKNYISNNILKLTVLSRSGCELVIVLCYNISMPSEEAYNFTDKQLKFSYWYVTHKLLLRKIFIISLAVVSFLLWFYVIWQLAFFGVYYQMEKYAVNNLIFKDNPNFLTISSLQPIALQVSDLQVLPGESGLNDYLSEITNNNRNWLATFDYQFIDGGKTYSQKGFALPLEKKFLMDLSVPGNISQLKLTNLKWRRVANPELIYNSRYKFKIENEDFIAGAGAGNPSRLVFDLTNASPFNYWQVGVQAFLYSGGNLASVNYLVLEQFKAGEKRQVQLNWTNRLSRITNMEIIPEVNVFAEDNIMPPTVEAEATTAQ